VPEADTAPLPAKTRVRIIEDQRGIPEGTSGTVRGVVGLTFPRHRVEFDNGRFVTSVARTSLVREGEWEQFQADRTAAAEAEAKRKAEAKDTAAEAPAEKPAEADAGGGETSAKDDRLAALMAKSKAAKARKAAEAG
jgi:hypothetical protein